MPNAVPSHRRTLGTAIPLLAALAAAPRLALAAVPATQPMAPDSVMPVLGRPVYSPAGALVGRIVDVLVDPAGQPQAAVLDVGGFLGVGNRSIAVHWATLRFNPTDRDHPVTVSMPADEIRAAPAYVDPAQPVQVVIPTAPAEEAPSPAAPPSPAPPSSTTTAPVPSPAEGGATETR